MTTSPPRLTARRAGFTLVEMLVVIGIIVILAALLTPAAYGVLIRGRDFAMSAEINKLQMAVEAYKTENGEYPPSFGVVTPNATVRSVLERHIAKCYPKCNPTHRLQFLNAVEPLSGSRTWTIDQSEALFFWLNRTVKNPILPFAGLPSSDANAEKRIYFEFDPRRLVDADGDSFPAFQPTYGRGTTYLYAESRFYDLYMNTTTGSPLRAEVETGFNAQNSCRPYFSDTFDATNAFGFKYMNPTTYQILCAGQNGDWGSYGLTTFVPTPDTTNLATREAALGIVRFASGRGGRGGAATNDPFVPADGKPGGLLVYTEADYDNIANFTEGKTFKIAMPPAP